MNTKKYFYTYEDYEEDGKSIETMADEILNDNDLINLKEIVVGCWGECYEDSPDKLLEMIVENKEKFAHIESLFIGDMNYEECEVSWIIQGNYKNIWSALPNLKKLTIKGSSELVLGNIEHDKLESLEIICGGLPQECLNKIAEAKLPNLKHLNLYLGVDDYGFSGSIEDIEKVINNKSFSNLKYLGLCDSEIQDEVVKLVINNDIIKQLEILDFSNGTLSDEGGKVILDNKEKLNHLKELDLHFHYMSDEVMNKIEKLPIKVDMSEQNENDEEYGNYPMLTE